MSGNICNFEPIVNLSIRDINRRLKFIHQYLCFLASQGGGGGGEGSDGLSTALSGNIVLGQDVNEAGNPAELTSNREIPLNENTLSITGTDGGSGKPSFTFTQSNDSTQTTFGITATAAENGDPLMFITETGSGLFARWGVSASNNAVFLNEDGSGRGVAIFGGTGNVLIGPTAGSDNGFELNIQGNTHIEGNPTIDERSALDIDVAYTGGDGPFVRGFNMQVSTLFASAPAPIEAAIIDVNQQTDATATGLSVSVNGGLTDQVITGASINAVGSSSATTGNTIRGLAAGCTVTDFANAAANYGIFTSASSQGADGSSITGGQFTIDTSGGDADLIGIGISGNVGGTGGAGTGINMNLVNVTNSSELLLGMSMSVSHNGSGNGEAMGINMSVLSNSTSPATGLFINVDNSGGADYAIIVLAGNTGLQATTPTAKLHIGAGAATAGTAPLKFTSGTNNTTAETGAMEYNGTNLFFTRTGTTRETILTASAVTTESIASNTTLTVNFNGTTYKLLAATV
jgi:hypothetical protein